MNRRTLVLLGAMLLSATSGATEDLARCAKLESSDERLACYDELARATESPSGGRVDTSPTPSHLSEVWKLGAKHGDARRLTDILGYRPTYIISRWSSDPNEQPTSPAPGRDSLATQDLDANEIKFQISFKAELVSRHAFNRIGVTPLLGHIGIDSVRLWFGYTHQVNWQMYNAAASRPFRETNYEPEVILTFGRGNEGDGFKLVNLGLVHQSNGRTESSSRGWNRVYAQGGWEWGRVSVFARVWHRLPESADDDDNPDITDYLGNGDLVARHQTEGGYVSSLLVRRRFVQLDWATPLVAALGVARLHVQLSSGYGESLIDYNHKQTTIGVGVSFGDW
ncbi:MAG TPA: phospholipase A [Burkholderiales bacterium]|nr:phospholipase A [Burkholderiales bacterium]